MANAKIYIGGTTFANAPNCNGSVEFVVPHAKRIAHDYDSGHYTFGWPLNPKLKEYQYNELVGANLAIGDHILMYVVPELHLITGVLSRVRFDSVTVDVNGASVGDSAMVGAALKPSALLYDSVTGLYVEDPFLDAAFTTVDLTTPSTVYAHLAAPYFVPAGKTLIVSFKVAALPSDPTVQIADMQAVAALVLKVQGFDIPTEV